VWSLWTCYIVNLLYHELWTCGLCDLLSTLLYCEVWYVYLSYFRFRPLPVYFPHRTFVSDVSEIPISFPFPELPFLILFPIKNIKAVMVLVFTDRFHPYWRPTWRPSLYRATLRGGAVGQISTEQPCKVERTTKSLPSNPAKQSEWPSLYRATLWGRAANQVSVEQPCKTERSTKPLPSNPARQSDRPSPHRAI
jgi:hypothetical protein